MKFKPQLSLHTFAAGTMFWTLLGLIHFGAASASSQTVFDSLWVTNGQVLTTIVSGNTIYIGGSFTYVGPSTGGGVALDTATGTVDPALPKVNGTIYAVVPDGSGGWYIGGAFTSVGGTTRNNIAHILQNKTLNANWNPDANSTVYALAFSGSTVYTGGTFTSIGGQTRNRIAALDTSTGLATSWNPNASFIVYALTLSGSTVYAGGEFTSIGGQTRNRIAALDTSTGSATSWNPSANNIVRALALDFVNARVYAGGGFSSVLDDVRVGIVGLTNPDDTALPVQIASFTAAAGRSGAELRWRTESEVENYGFEIERRSVTSSGLRVSGSNQHETLNTQHATEWAKIGFVPGAGTSTSPRDYSFIDKPDQPGRYAYRIKQIDHSGAFTYTSALEVEVGVAPLVFALAQNYPNPFNPTTTIEFTLPEDGRVVLKVFNMLGEEVMTLLDEERIAGVHHQAVFDAGRLASGSYLVQLQFLGNTLLRKVVLLK